LIQAAQGEGIPLRVLTAVEEANERQKMLLVDKVTARFGADLSGRHFAVWGLAFKPNTDDMREAPALVIVQTLLKLGATITAYDPVAMPEARRLLAKELASDRLRFSERADQALEGADALLLVTEWKEFKSPDFDLIKSSLKQPVVFDGRNQYEPTLMKALGIEHWGIGRGQSQH